MIPKCILDAIHKPAANYRQSMLLVFCINPKGYAKFYVGGQEAANRNTAFWFIKDTCCCIRYLKEYFNRFLCII